MDMTAIIESVTKQVLGSAGASASAPAAAAVNTYIDHTVLAADTPLTKIDQFCKEAIEYKFRVFQSDPCEICGGEAQRHGRERMYRDRVPARRKHLVYQGDGDDRRDRQRRAGD